MDRTPYQRLAVAGLAAALGVVPRPATAGVWTATPEFSASTDYSSNPQLRLDQPVSGYAAVMNLGLPASWNGGAWLTELAPRVRLGAGAGGDSALGANAYYVSGSARLASERGSLGMTARWADDSAAIAEPAAGTLTLINIRRREDDAGLDWSHALSPRYQTGLNASWQSVSYQAVPGSGLFDYRYATLAEQSTATVTEKTQLQLVVSASRYDVPTFSYGERSYSAQVGVGGKLNERWSFSLSYGASRLQPLSAGPHISGAVYKASAQWQGLKSTLSAQVSQSYQPSGFGTLALTRDATLRADFRRTERLSTYLALRAATERDSFGALNYASRSYDSAVVGIVWAVSPVWDLSSELRWQRQQQRYFSSDASGRASGIVISLVRKFDRLRLG
jgi:hypothetical protein